MLRSFIKQQQQKKKGLETNEFNTLIFFWLEASTLDMKEKGIEMIGETKRVYLEIQFSDLKVQFFFLFAFEKVK